MTKKMVLEDKVKKWSKNYFDNLPDIKIHNGEVKEKTKYGKWEYV